MRPDLIGRGRIMTRQVVLIHGWSAQERSMADIARLLESCDYATVDIWLGGYPSTDDDLRIEDAARRLGEEIAVRQGDGRLGAKFHLIVHSTGALVARRWLADRFPAGGSPVENFLMLAPANFGSPLAHVGRSVLGRMKVGLTNRFQSGTQVLHGLELGSQFQQDLALSDRLSRDGEAASPYGEDGARLFVIVGALRVTGTQILNETGWDGTVRIASAHMDPHGMTIDFREDPAHPAVKRWSRRGPKDTAFAVLPDRDHLSILDPDKSEAASTEVKGRLKTMVMEALEVGSAAQYREVTRRWKEEINEDTRWLASSSPEARARFKEVFGSKRIPPSRFHEHYQVVVNVRDAAGFAVEDFGIWMSSPTERALASGARSSKPDVTEIRAHSEVVTDVHVNKRDASRRVLHLDRYKLMGPDGYFDAVRGDRTLMAAISADPPGRNVNHGLRRGQAFGYLPLRPSHSGLPDDHPERFLRRWATHFIEVILPRQVEERAFRLRSLKTLRDNREKGFRDRPS